MKKYSLFLLPLIGTILLIFSLSMQDATTSNALSKETTRIVTSVIEATPMSHSSSVALSNSMVRDLAHMGLFFILGIITLLNCWVHHFSYGKSALLTLLLSMVIALCDETIQLSSMGRAFEWVDIYKDVLGCLGSLIFFSIFYKVLKLNKKALRFKI